MEHPSEEILQRFVAGTASRDESRSVVAHLLKGCALCARKIRSLMEPTAMRRREDYDAALERFDRRLIEGLESSISPDQALRTELGRLLDDDHEPPPGRRPPQREH